MKEQFDMHVVLAVACHLLKHLACFVAKNVAQSSCIKLWQETQRLFCTCLTSTPEHDKLLFKTTFFYYIDSHQ